MRTWVVPAAVIFAMTLTLLGSSTAVGRPGIGAAQTDADAMTGWIDLARERPSEIGPLNGELVQRTGSVASRDPGLDVRDFYAHISFTAPTGADNWDYGFGFRSLGTVQYRLVIDASGTWYFYLYEDGGEPTLSSGRLRGFDTASGAANEIDLVVVDDVGYFALNGDFVTSLDTAELTASGDVWIGTAFAVDNTVDGNTTSFRDFEVWSLDDPTPGGPTPEVGGGGDGEEFARLMVEAVTQPSAAGPLDGDLTMGPDSFELLEAGVDLRDFYAHAEFTNPYAASEHLWDIGFGFRHLGTDEQFRLIVDSDGAWFFKEGTEPALSTGRVDGLDTAANGTNELDLVAVGETGYFGVNGDYVATLDLSGGPDAGDVWVGAGLFREDAVEGETTAFADFEVWSLDAAGADTGTPGSDEPEQATPEADGTASAAEDGAELVRLVEEARARPSLVGPTNGELLQTEGSATVDAAVVAVRDLYAHVRFTNPEESERWDYGLIFRDQGGTDHYRLILDSTGGWYLSEGPGPELASGTVASLDDAAGASNELDLAVVGDVGYFGVNGEYVATLDLGNIDGEGDVWVGTAFYAVDTVDGAITPYRDFEVWSLDAAVDAGTAVATIEPEVTAEPTAEAEVTVEPEPTEAPESTEEPEQTVEPEPTPELVATAEPTAEPEPTAEATSDASSSGGDQIAVRLEAGDAAAVSGLVVLTAVDGQTEIDVTLIGARGGELVVVHEGTCVDPDPAPAFLLRDLDATGRSGTTLNVSLDQLRSSPHAIAVHAGIENFDEIVACGEVPAA